MGRPSAVAVALHGITKLRQLLLTVVIEHVLAQAVDVARSELYGLGRGARGKVLGKDIRELQARPCVVIRR